MNTKLITGIALGIFFILIVNILAFGLIFYKEPISITLPVNTSVSAVKSEAVVRSENSQVNVTQVTSNDASSSTAQGNNAQTVPVVQTPPPMMPKRTRAS